jgi:hypothetical protein
LLAVLLLLPSVAEATGAWTNCGGSEVGVREKSIGKGDLVCWEYDAAADDSTKFEVVTEEALLSFDPDNTTDGAAVATIMIRRCHRRSVPGTPANECMAMLDVDLDGTTGSDAAQNCCKWIPRGVYVIDNTGEPANLAIVSVQGR